MNPADKEAANDTESEDEQQIFEIPKKINTHATFSMVQEGSNKPTMVAFKPPRFLDAVEGQQILS